MRVLAVVSQADLFDDVATDEVPVVVERDSLGRVALERYGADVVQKLRSIDAFLQHRAVAVMIWTVDSYKCVQTECDSLDTVHNLEGDHNLHSYFL